MIGVAPAGFSLLSGSGAEGGDSRKSPPFCLPSRVSTPTPEERVSQAVRYIPKSIKHTVWMRDRGTCVKCGSLRNLQYDHIHPVALGGDSTVENVRLLCFSCNQRRAIQTFGIRAQV
jgi:5-methylcytosine-specific restriction endonuclease McrA